MYKLLTQNRNFRLLWTGQLISALGDRLTQMGVLTFLMVSSHDEGSKTALITFFGLLPFLLFGPLFGALVDRHSRKNLMILADAGRAILVLSLPVIWVHTHSMLYLILCFFVIGTFTAVFSPAKMSIIVNITDKENLLSANSMIATTGTVATLVGTLIAGGLIKITGTNTAFYINSATYIISALIILRIIYKQTLYTNKTAESNPYKIFVNDIKEGLHYIRRHRLIKQLILLNTVFSFISSFAYILILNYAASILKQSSFGIGGLLSSTGFGMVVGSIILIKRKDKVKYHRALYLSYLIIGVFSGVFFFKPDFLASLIILFCAGIGAAILEITLDTIFQRITPNELQGKIFAARGALANIIFLGSLLLVGSLIKFISAEILFGIIGICGLFTFLGIFLSEKRWGYALTCRFFRFLMKVYFNFKVSGIENLPKTRRVILAGNHTSVLDGIVLACAYPGRIYFLVADTAFKTKFFGWWLKRLGYISIKRGGFNKEAIREAVGIIKSGYSLGIFPEGKISKDGRLMEGKEGIAVIAQLAEIEIIPFAIEGAYEAWPLPQKYPRRFPISVKFGSPLKIEDYPVERELVDEVMEDISKLKLELEREGYLKLDPNEIIKHLLNAG